MSIQEARAALERQVGYAMRNVAADEGGLLHATMRDADTYALAVLDRMRGDPEYRPRDGGRARYKRLRAQIERLGRGGE